MNKSLLCLLGASFLFACGSNSLSDDAVDSSTHNIVASQGSPLRETIEHAAEGAMFASETDMAFDYVEMKLDAPADKVTEGLARKLLEKAEREAGKHFESTFAMTGDLTDIYDASNCDADLDGRCAELAELASVLDDELEGLTVYYFGDNGSPGRVDGVEVTVLAIGFDSSGYLVGVMTGAVWT